MAVLGQLLERYEQYLDRGVGAARHGRLTQAREYLLLAAERLFEIAGESPGELQRLRAQRAGELLDEVERIDRRIDREKQAPAASCAERQGDEEATGCPVAAARRADVTLADVAGLDDVKRLIRDRLIDPFLYPEMAEQFGLKAGGGILLYGPPGTGKSLIARAIAGEVDAALFHVLPGDVLSKWVGDPEKNIRALFAEAESHPRSVLFFDEIDALAASRRRSEQYMRRLVNQLLAEVQGFEKRRNPVLILGATNHPALVDRAMLRAGRFDELVYVSLPDAAARRAIWQLNLASRQRVGRFDFDRLAERSDGHSGAEIAMVCDKAAREAFHRCRAGDDNGSIDMRDVEAALEQVPPRTSAADLDELMAFARRYDRNLFRGTGSSEGDPSPAKAPGAPTDAAAPPASPCRRSGGEHLPAVIEDVEDLLIGADGLDFSDVAGMEALKREMSFAVEVPVDPRKRATYERITGGLPENAAMLLYGAPGCGKTFLARAAAGEFARRFGLKVILVPTRAIDSLHYTRKCPRVAEIFNLAKRRAPALVIWDELDGIASPPMFSGRRHNAAVCTALKSQFEGIVRSGRLVVHIATSNYPWDLEPALMRQGRLGRCLHVLPPDRAARRATLQMMLEGADLADDVDFDALAERTAGMTVGELRKVTSLALNRTVQQSLTAPADSGPDRVTMDVLLAAVAANPAVAFRTWLAGARRTLHLPRYQCQREMFRKLLADITRFLDGGEEP